MKAESKKRHSPAMQTVKKKERENGQKRKRNKRGERKGQESSKRKKEAAVQAATPQNWEPRPHMS